MGTACDDDVTIYVASGGVQNTELTAGLHEPWTLPGRNDTQYYDEPQYSERCETVRCAELVDCRVLRDPQLDPVLHRHLGTHFVNAAAKCGAERIRGSHRGPVPGTFLSLCLGHDSDSVRLACAS